MAKIRIDDFELESYEHGWQLSKLHTATKGAHAGKVVNGDYTYHASLSAALRAVQERHLRASTATSLKALRSDVKALHEEILNAFDTGEVCPAP